MLELPNSRLRIQYSTKYWRVRPSDSDRSLMPDVPMKESWKDFVAGMDAALDARRSFSGGGIESSPPDQFHNSLQAAGLLHHMQQPATDRSIQQS
jgi:hypothetical protein